MYRNPLAHIGQPSILLAEDDPDQSQMLKETLSDEGYLVDTAFSGDSALHKLSNYAYDLIILDVRMPGLDGVTVMQRFRSQNSHSKVPVVIVSSFATNEDIARYKNAGANACFSKPYDIDELLIGVDALLNRTAKP